MEVFEELAQMVSSGEITPDDYEEALCNEEYAQELIDDYGPID